MAGVRGEKHHNTGKYQGWFRDFSGKRKFFWGSTNRKDTLRAAERLEDDHRQIRLGYRPVPHSSSKHLKRTFSEVKAEYLEWGNAHYLLSFVEGVLIRQSPVRFDR